MATATDSDSFHRGFRSGGSGPTHSRADSHGMVAKERAVSYGARLGKSASPSQARVAADGARIAVNFHDRAGRRGQDRDD